MVIRKKEASLEWIIDRRKKVPNQLASGEIEKLSVFLF